MKHIYDTLSFRWSQPQPPQPTEARDRRQTHLRSISSSSSGSSGRGAQASASTSSGSSSGASSASVGASGASVGEQLAPYDEWLRLRVQETTLGGSFNVHQAIPLLDWAAVSEILPRLDDSAEGRLLWSQVVDGANDSLSNLKMALPGVVYSEMEGDSKVNSNSDDDFTVPPIDTTTPDK